MRGKKIKMREMRSRLIFGACTIISGAAAMFGVNVLPVMAEENVGEEMVVGNDAPDTGENELSENALNTGETKIWGCMTLRIIRRPGP